MGKEKESKTEKIRVMSAHQPNFLPYLGFFEKIKDSDVFVIRDEVDFVERDYHHRNRIRIDGKDANGEPQWKWLTIPVKKAHSYIKDITIKNDVKEKNVFWNVYMLRQIKSNYETTPFFKQYFPELEKIIMTKHEKLIDLNMEIINFLKDIFDIKTPIVLASQLQGYRKVYEKSMDLLNLTKATNADIYLSGKGGESDYRLDLELFHREGIEVKFQNYQHPFYRQRFQGFVPCLASIDALFNVGPEILKKSSSKEGDKQKNRQAVEMQ